MHRVFLLATALLVACSSVGSTPTLAPPPPAAPLPGRVVALGDLHGDLRQTVAALALAGLIDRQGHWAGGTTTFVQTGDVVDRGPDSRGVLDLLRRLESEAPQTGGRVVLLLGNHERMNTSGDLRYVSPDDVTDFASAEARAEAFSPRGDYGRWLQEHDAVAIIGDTVFVHGGVRERWAQQGAKSLNLEIRQDLFSRGPASGASGEDGPLWYRGYVREPEVPACAELAEALRHLGARRMVVGHTTQNSGRILSRCNGALHAIDVGLSAAYGSHLAIWEATAGDARALYPGGPEDLPDPR